MVRRSAVQTVVRTVPTAVLLALLAGRIDGAAAGPVPAPGSRRSAAKRSGLPGFVPTKLNDTEVGMNCGNTFGQPPIFLLVFGVPAAGKSTLAPVLNAVVRAMARSGRVDAPAADAAIDELLRTYRGLELLADPLERLRAVVATAAWPAGIAAAIADGLGSCPESELDCAETDSFPGYRDERGHLRRDLTPNAMAACISRALRGECSVMVPGTGLHTHCLLALLKHRPEDWFKIVAPPPGTVGFFETDLESARQLRSTPAAERAGKYVSPDVMGALLRDQWAELSEGGTWAEMMRRRRGSDLAELLEHRIARAPDAERLRAEHRRIEELLGLASGEALRSGPVS